MRPTMRHLVAVAIAVLTFSARANIYITPVATAKVNGRVFVTTTVLQNRGSRLVTCESRYALPDEGSLRARYSIEPGDAQVDDATLMEAGAVGTIRFDCSGDVLIAARIRISEDGGTFKDRTFRCVNQDNPITSTLPKTL